MSNKTLSSQQIQLKYHKITFTYQLSISLGSFITNRQFTRESTLNKRIYGDLAIWARQLPAHRSHLIYAQITCHNLSALCPTSSLRAWNRPIF